MRGLAVVTAALVLSVSMACGESATTGSLNGVEQGADREQDAGETFTVGETAVIESLEHTVYGARWSSGAHEPGDRWLTIDVGVVRSEDSDGRGAMTWHLFADEAPPAVQFGADAGAGALERIEAGDEQGRLSMELQPGREMRGEMTYRVAEGQTRWELTYIHQEFGFPRQAIWVIDEESVSG